MDFETSCWSAGSSLINNSPAFYNVDNPVQRRKIDYFDSSSMAPIVSHISSNGYYGYCPTMPSTLADVHQEPSIQNGTTNGTDFSMSDMDIPAKVTQPTVALAAAATETTPNAQKQQQQQQQPMHHQGRLIFENRKRTVQYIDEYIAEQDIKRQRRNQLSTIDYAEDMQMCYDDLKDATSNAYANFGNSSSLNNINSIVNPTINANKKSNNSHIQSAMMMSHMI